MGARFGKVHRKRSAAQLGHFGVQASLIDEHRSGGGEIELTAELVATTLQQVGTFVLQFMCGLF